jgi:hypothetical protein
MKAGDVYRFTKSADVHRWVVISDPVIDPERVLCVNITSYDPREDQACCLEPADHPSLTCRSLVNYSRARVTTNENLDAFLAAGLVRMLDPVSDALLKRIRQCAMDSTRMKLADANILIEQELVD